MTFSSRIFTCLLALLFAGQGFAQTSLDKANQLYEDLSYSAAIPFYQKAVERGGTTLAKSRLADCYRIINDYQEAEYWYAQVADAADADPIVKLYYGMALQSNGKCDQAVPYFRQYSSLAPQDPRGARFAKDCGSIATDGTNLYEISNVAFNGSTSEMGPAFFGNGLIFSAAKGAKGIARTHAWMDQPFYDLQYVDINNNTPSATSRILAPVWNTKFHDGPACFNKTQDKIYFTRNDGKDGESVTRLKIFEADINSSGEFSNIKELPFNLDNKNYSVAHPALSNDGMTLYFSSDMPGGYGGNDIYMAKNNGSSWGPAQNLGSTINTAGDEMFPFIHPDGTMFLASTGHGGFGALDIFMTQGSGASWSAPANLGAPINSNKDDFGLIINENRDLGFFASDREGGKGSDDIYMVKALTLFLTGTVVDCNTGAPVSGADVQLNDLVTGGSVDAKTDANGNFNFTIGPDRKYEVKANKSISSYTTGFSKVSTFGMAPGGNLTTRVCLDKQRGSGMKAPVGPANLIGKLVDATTGEPINQGTIILQNRCTGADVTLTSDASGNFNFSNLQNGCEYYVQGSKSTYSIDAKAFNAPQNGPTYVTLRVNQNAKEWIIYYDLDKYNIRPDAEATLQDVRNWISANSPGARLELASHTDSRASQAYNVRLAKNRSNSSRAWLSRNGISNIETLSFGESNLVNKCADNIPCTEGEHQLNRRTVIRVITR